MSKNVKVGMNDLKTTHPEIAAQWHNTKNGSLKPSDFTHGSSKKVWWQCKHGHEWEAAVYSRTNGKGCPYCAGQLVISGETDLQTIRPDLAAQWYSVKNGDLTPDKVKVSSNKKVWWVCEHGHEWEAVISSRTSGSGCPYCTGKLPIRGETDLQTLYPHIAKQWHKTLNENLKPTDVTVGSDKKIWWICEHGHEWKAPIKKRALRNQGCPYCSGKRPIVGVTDLATTCPNIAELWHQTLNKNLNPSDVKAKSNKKVWWQCKHGHEWKAKISEIIISKEPCPYCAGRLPIPNETDLATTRPDLASEWHSTKNIGLKDSFGRDISTPDKVLASSNQKVWWQCKHGHEWASIVSNRSKGQGCPYCVGSLVVQGKDLQSLYPDIAAEWDNEANKDLVDGFGRGISIPDKVLPMSNQKVGWQCKKGHKWKSLISDRVEKGCGCPICKESHGEKEIRKILDKNFVRYIPQYKFKDRTMPNSDRSLRDDFAILNSEGQVVGTIEYHGEQHYMAVDFAGKGSEWAEEQLKLIQARDAAKTKYLQEHNIPQLIIPYWDFSNIESIVRYYIKKIFFHS